MTPNAGQFTEDTRRQCDTLLSIGVFIQLAATFMDLGTNSVSYVNWAWPMMPRRCACKVRGRRHF